MSKPIALHQLNYGDCRKRRAQAPPTRRSALAEPLVEKRRQTKSQRTRLFAKPEASTIGVFA